MLKFNQKDNAVSPVIGVLLMLVVTIIIAAVVSGFAGGLAGGSEKAPQIALGVEAKYGGSIILTHQGGDPLSWSNIEIKTLIPTGSYKDMSYSLVKTSGTYLPTGAAISDYTEAFKPGDSARFDWDDCFATSSYGLMAPSAGDPLNVLIFDKNSGKTIVTKQVSVLP